MDEPRHEEDEPVAGELIPLDDMAKALFMGLSQIPDQVVGERRELAEALRRCFFELDTTMRRYAAERNYSASSLSRYLSGETVAPDRFVNTLMDDVGRKLGRPMAPQARHALTRMQRAALKATNTRAWQVQRLEDELIAALREKDLARTMADAVATSLLEHQERVAALEADRQALTQEVAAHKTAGIELNLLRAEQHRMLTDQQALRRRVAELEAALEAAEQRVTLAEQRCAELEHTLLAADVEAAAEEGSERRRTEERLARSQEELVKLRQEMASLRISSTQETPAEDGTSPRTPIRSLFAEAVSHVTVVFSGYHRPWAAWIAQRLETHGHVATLQRWDPPREVPLEDSLGDLLLARGQVLLVLDDWFFQLGPRAAGEWNDVLRGFVAAHADRFAAVNLTNRSLLPATTVLEPVSLWGVGEEEAETRLLNRLALQTRRAEARRVPRAMRARYPDDPPEIWGEIPRRNPHFTGRDDLLTGLQARLTDAGRDSALCTLFGMSGIGKTQIAAEYAHRFSSDYDVVWWVSSDDRNVQRDRFGELAAELNLPVGSEPGERIRAVREALRRGDPHSRWLIVFDGWDDTDGANVILPHGPGHVLVTSRNRAWGDHTHLLEVPGFDRADSTAYLMRRAPHITAPEADEVAAEFGDVPLPLVQAAAWLGESHMEVSEYLHMVREGRISAMDEPTGGDGFPQASLTSWSILINRLRRAQPQAVDVLSLCASFAPGRIPIGLLRTAPVAHLPEGLRWIAAEPAAWTRALDTLVNYSVLTRESRDPMTTAEAGPAQETVHMHRLVHDIAARLTDGEHRDAEREAVRTLLAEADPGDPMDSRHWPRYAEILPHLEPSGALRSAAPGVRSTVLNCLRYCVHSGDYQAGVRLAERVRPNWSGFMDPADGPMLDLAALEADVLRATNRFREAQQVSLLALRELQTVTPHDELTELTARGAVANGLRQQGVLHEAYRIHREVLDRTNRLVGADDPRTLAARHDIGVTLRALGDYREAYDHDRVTLAWREELYGRDHMTTLASANAVTHSQRLLGEYDAALARQEGVARLHRQVLGPRHPQTLEADIQLALCRSDRDASDDENDSFAELLERAVDVHGHGHHVALQCAALYANVLRERGDFDLARELITEAEAGYRALLGPAHPVSTGILAATALVMHASGERDTGLTIMEAALAGLTAALDPDHPWVLGCALNASALRSHNGGIAEAAELSGDILRRARHVLGDEHPLTLSCQVAQAADLRGLRRTEEAAELEENALLTLTRKLGALHPETLAARRGSRPLWAFTPHVE
ncbi:FxSxx-COOH system tetratricopeptide repeat protein [Streptomyces sp. NPDC097704]|uniref:FxSxx-COOH system tetratricopeptide repeat protein n=1 Tax=Streptomyces sp. NPDC097704 TaxID=3157101 RepID=UPI0033170F4C